VNYPPPNLWTQVQIDPAPEPEPQLVEVTTAAWHRRLFVPADWSEERRAAWLERWMRW